MNVAEFYNENIRLGHAIQSGVMMEHELGSEDGSPKHLRVGVNMALLETAAIAHLLIDKGIIKEEDYFDYVIKALKSEVSVYEQRLSEHLGTKVTLE